MVYGMRRFRVETSSGEYIDIEVDGKGDEFRVKVSSNNRIYNVKILSLDSDTRHAVLEINGKRTRISGLEGGLVINGVPAFIKKIIELIPTGVSKDSRPKKLSITREKGVITVPISGRIVDIKVKPGDTVSEDTIIALIESMKMITEIKAGLKGVVEEVYVSKNKPVKKGEKLVKVKPIEEGKKKRKRKRKD